MTTPTCPCPLCGNEHELKYEHKGVTLFACPEAEPDKIYSYNMTGGMFDQKLGTHVHKPIPDKLSPEYLAEFQQAKAGSPNLHKYFGEGKDED